MQILLRCYYSIINT